MLFKKLHGVHVKHCKNTARLAPQRIPTPKNLYIPMAMHIGAPATPVVKTGDLVKVGQVIAEASGYVSAKIHSSVSGKVKNTEIEIEMIEEEDGWRFNSPTEAVYNESTDEYENINK